MRHWWPAFARCVDGRAVWNGGGGAMWNGGGRCVWGAICALLIGSSVARAQQASPAAADTEVPFALAPCALDGAADARCGTYWVYEDRARRSGRRIPLKVIVLPARTSTPAPDPVWLVSPGGPGSTNSEALPLAAGSWWRDSRDVVLVDLRGTSGPNRLDCQLPGSDEHPEGYLATVFSAQAARACRDQLSQRADLRLYTTPIIIGDLEEVRKGLGLRTVNLWGGSWGTRAVLLYLRMHPEAVRSAIIEGIAPPSLKNPLPHARSAQDAIDLLFAECQRQAPCHAAFPDVRRELDTVVERLKRQPATVTVASPHDSSRIATQLGWPEFAEALRVTSYYDPPLRDVPMLVHRAYLGDFDRFAATGIASNRGLHSILRYGFLLSITCTEDVSRIDPKEVGPATAGTYYGDARVREQMAACSEWPHGVMPKGYGDPVRSNVPVFLLSGTVDPVSPPHFGTDAARYLPNAIHVIAPGGHVPAGPCIVAMERAFLEAASAKVVDTSCVGGMSLAPFRVVDSLRS